MDERPLLSTTPGFGLVVSGGAACGLANVGIIEAIHEAGLRPSCLSGSSMGAIVGALYALGRPPSDLRALAEALRPLDVVRLSATPLRGGLHGGLLAQSLETHLDPMIGDARIGDCEIPFVCVAGKVREPIRWERALRPGFTDYVLERIVVHVFDDDTRVIDAVRASSAIPVVFSPASIDGDEYVDLLHFGAIPARALRERCNPRVVIGTDTQPRYDRLEPWLPPPLREFLSAGRAEVERSIEACDLVIRPPLPASSMRFDRGTEFARAGHTETLARLDEIRALLSASGVE